MALTSIQAPPTNKAIFSFNRGNGGVLVDVQGNKNMLFLPEVTGGGGETSYVF
jgi:hypothetical protein